MSNPLTSRLRVLRRRLRGRTALAGGCTVLAVGLAAAMAIGTIDFVIRLEDPGLRIIATVTLGTVLIAAINRYLLVPLRRRSSDIALAQRIEKRHPSRGDLLSNAVAFSRLSEDAAGAGSAALRRAIIVQATAASEEINWNAVIPRKPVRRAVTVLGMVLGILVVLFLVNRPVVQIAAARLLRPVGTDHWPRSHQLVLRNAPARVALGGPLQIEVADDAGPLPEQVWLHRRTLHDGGWSEEESPMTIAGDTAIARMEEVTQPFEFRVSGGDDNTMSWHAVDVVEPPRLRRLTIRLQPPAYTQYPEVDSRRHIRAMEGTRIAISGESTEPLKRARLMLDQGDAIDAEIESDRHRFSIPAASWVATRSTSYWFELVDADDLTGGGLERYALRVTPDSPPTIAFEEPTGDLYVTPTARVPLRLLAKDNLAIHTVSLLCQRSDQSEAGDVRQILSEGPSVASPNQAHDDPTRDRGERRIVEFAWDLADLQLSAGADLLVHATATDYRPSVGQTHAPLRIYIVTPDELEERLAEQHSVILGLLWQALRIEREARERIRSVQVQLQEYGQLGSRDQDPLQTAELSQRRVEQQLFGPKEGIPRHITALLDQMDSCQIDNPSMIRRLGELTEALGSLEQNEIPTIRRALTAAIKAADSEWAADNAQQSVSAARSLAAVAGGQDRVIETIERLAGDLEQWAGYQRFARELGQLRNDQQALAETVRRELGTRNVDQNQLDRRQRTELKKAAEHQQELARRLDAIGPRISQVIDDLSESEPLVAQTLSDGLDVLRRQGIAGQMRDAGRNIEQNRISRAVEQQNAAIVDLEAVLDTLRNRRENELEHLVEKLREAELDMTALREQLARLEENVADAAEDPANADDPDSNRQPHRLQELAHERETLRNEIARLARRLKRLTADRAGRTTQQAADRLEDRSDSKDEPPERAGQGGATAAEFAEAKQDLEKAQEQLAEARRNAEEDLAQQQRQQWEVVIRSVIDAQQSVFGETQRLDSMRQANQQFTPAQTQSLRDVADEQLSIRDETLHIAERSQGMGVLRLALRRAADSMTTAAVELTDQQTGAAAQEAEASALARLEQIITALTEKTEDREPGNQEEPAGGGGGEGGAQQPCGNGQSIDPAELRLLKALQVELHEQTTALEQRLTTTSPPDAVDQGVFLAMSTEQAQLAELVFALTDPDNKSGTQPAPADDDPDDDLPDLEVGLSQDRQLPPLDIAPLQGGTLNRSQTTEEDRSEVDQAPPETLGDAEGEDLGSSPETNSPRNPILRIAEQMRGASQAMSKGDASGKASGLQAAAIAELDQLLEQLKCTGPKPPPSAGNKNASRNDRPKPSSPGKANDPNQQGNQAARDASSGTKSGDENASDVKAMQNLIKDVWGNLPARARAQMLESPPEEFLPEYELEIEQYFKRLAEEPERSGR